MDAKIRAAVVNAVKEINVQWTDNKNYAYTGQQIVGPYVVCTVEFTDDLGNEKYTNFALVKGEIVEGAYFFLADAIREMDRGLSWRSLLVGQFTTVVGSIMILLFVIAIIFKILVLGGEIDPKLWIIVSAGVGYLFGAKPSIKSQLSAN